ncbi:MAG TPA: PepSY-associated TM helix domain-containing protein [Reyranella sp.]|nr:PepSY-associated TM helix domain-containing protein [Reyranella sp.]
MNARTLKAVHWLRKTHGWFGLWGAILGLLAGFSGIWLNHRATLKLDLPGQRQINAQIALPEPAPATPQAMAAWLQDALKLDRPANNLRVERARPVPWSEKGQEQSPLMQPARWTFSFGGPNRVIQIEYWQGNRSASVRTTENGFVATLTNLHKGVGMPVAWVLLIDTLAGSLIFLTLSGVVLWWTTNRRKRVGIAIFGASVALTVGLALWPTTQ